MCNKPKRSSHIDSVTSLPAQGSRIGFPIRMDFLKLTWPLRSTQLKLGTRESYLEVEVASMILTSCD